MIDSYQFGEMVIDRQTYRQDLIIYPDHVDTHWWRKSGHELAIDDIQDILAVHPDSIVVGTGQPGLMAVLTETRDFLERRGIELIVKPTSQAVQTFNTLHLHKTVVGAFHLTC